LGRTIKLIQIVWKEKLVDNGKLISLYHIVNYTNSAECIREGYQSYQANEH